MALPLRSVLAISLATLLPCLDPGHSQEPGKPAEIRSTAIQRAAPKHSALAKARADVIEKIKKTRTGAEKLLALREIESERLADALERRRGLYDKGLIAANEVRQAEHEFIESLRRVEENKRSIKEADMAITEATMGDELQRLPGLGVGGYSETATLLRFNGASSWSLAQAAQIEKFFSATFGQTLPISALGQTATHDRLRFDHRDAMDVALHPDSHEGRALLSYLRQAGIPYIAFRRAVPGGATGAHIHIGKPSARL